MRSDPLFASCKKKILSMIGYAHAVGPHKHSQLDAGLIARYFSVDEDSVSRAISLIVSAESPEILLIQNSNLDDKVQAAVVYPSIWSHAYSRIANPYGRVHRDFHYQVMFVALASLAEVGCKQIRIDNPAPERQWRKDAYICLSEASRNIQIHMGSEISIFLKHGQFDPKRSRELDAAIERFDLQAHRPVGISPYIFEGLNMKRVFIENAVIARNVAAGSVYPTF